MVTVGVPEPVYTLVTVPSEETAATVGSLEVQVTVPSPPERVAVRVRDWAESRVPSVTSRVKVASGSREGSSEGSGVSESEVVSRR